MICKGCGKEYLPRHSKDIRCAECYSKLGRNSKNKGSSNERRFSSKLQTQLDKHGFKYKVRRVPMSGAMHEFEASDLLWSNLPGDSIFKRHFELKNSSTWDIPGWFEKAKQIEIEQGTNRPVTLVIRKPSSHQAYIVVDEDDFIKILIENEVLKYEQKR